MTQLRVLALLAVVLAALPALAGQRIQARCVYVVDGDTIAVEVGGLRSTVRLIGMDTPERGEPGYKEAKAFTSRAVLERDVVLEMDVQPVDRYGRNLAYVWVDGRMLNLELVRAGLAVPATYPPNVAHVDEIREAGNKAGTDGEGLWSLGTETREGHRE